MRNDLLGAHEQVSIGNFRHMRQPDRFLTSSNNRTHFLLLCNVVIKQERSASEGDRRKCVRAGSVWLPINSGSQKQEFPFFGPAVRAEVHVACRLRIKNVGSRSEKDLCCIKCFSQTNETIPQRQKRR